MGSISYFDEVLPSISQESNVENPERQLEIFTYQHKLWIRVGQTNQQNSGSDRYTVELSKESAKALIQGIKDGMRFLGEEI